MTALRQLVLAILAVVVGATIAMSPAFAAPGTYAYDAGVERAFVAHEAAHTTRTPATNTRAIAAASRSGPRTSPGHVRLFSGFVRAAKAGRGAGRGAGDVLEGLPRGRQPHVRTVGSDDELRSVYDELAAGDKPVDVRGYPGKWIERPDGTRIGIREGSKRGGATIDIRRPDGSIGKVHIR